MGSGLDRLVKSRPGNFVAPWYIASRHTANAIQPCKLPILATGTTHHVRCRRACFPRTNNRTAGRLPGSRRSDRHQHHRRAARPGLQIKAGRTDRRAPVVQPSGATPCIGSLGIDRGAAAATVSAKRGVAGAAGARGRSRKTTAAAVLVGSACPSTHAPTSGESGRSRFAPSR